LGMCLLTFYPIITCAYFDIRTYNALIGESEYYSSERSNFIDSHKTFKRAIRSFNWEVLEVFSELPVVAFSWRHFGLFHGKFTCESFLSRHQALRSPCL
jgi:hypothetical protein